MLFSAAGFFEQSITPLCVLDLEGVVVAANAAFAASFARTTEALLGTAIINLANEALLPDISTALSEGRQGLSCKFQLLGRDSKGAEQIIEITASPSIPRGYLYCVGRRPLHVVDEDTATHTTGRERLQELVREVATTLDTQYAFISFLREWPATRVEMIATWANGAPGDPFEYELEGTPCQTVLEGKLASVPEGVIQAFPNDKHLPEMSAESYIGLPVKDEMGLILGHVCVLDPKPLQPAKLPQQTEVLRAAARAAARELSRLRAENLLAFGPEGSVSLEGTALYHAITRQIATALQADIVFASEYLDPPTHARMLSFWDGKSHAEGHTYAIDNTPCSLVLRGDICQIPTQTQARFPGNEFLKAQGIESCVAVPLVDSEGNSIGVLAMMTRKPMEAVEERAFSLRLFAGRIASEMERLRLAKNAEASDARFRLLVEHAADMLIGYEPDGTIRECNRAAEEALGCSRNDIIGKNLAVLRESTSPEDIAHETSLLEPAVPKSQDAIFRRKDGSTFPVELRIVLFEHDGRTLALASARDVTEQRRAAQLLQSAVAALQTPIIEVWDGIVALPVIGAVDSERASKMTLALLQTISEKQAEVAILDLTGVHTVDEETANHLLGIARAASLLGSDCLVSGMAPAVARTLVDLGTPEQGFRTFATLQSALRHALSRKGVKVSRRA